MIFQRLNIKSILFEIFSYFVAYLLEVEWTSLLRLSGLVEAMSQEQEDDECLEDWKNSNFCVK